MSELKADSKDDQNEILDLDNILVHSGYFGKFQRRTSVFVGITFIFLGFQSMAYIFTTRTTNYRCFIDECDNSTIPQYKEDWIWYTIPKKDDSTELKKCYRYAHKEVDNMEPRTCHPENFDNSTEIKCDRFIFEEINASIESSYNITCDENLWKLTLVGTLQNLAELIFLPVAGLMSDKFGRRTVMIGGLLVVSICGIIKALMSTYEAFITFDFFEAAVGCGIYSSAFILAMELVAPERRVLGSTIISCTFTSGTAVFGLATWLITSWRPLILTYYIPGLFFVFYFWCVNDSVRWLLSKGQVEKAKTLLKKVAKVNGTKLPDHALAQLGVHENEFVAKESVLHIFKSLSLLLRVVVCSLVWISCMFLYNGQTLHAVSLSGNESLNFIAVTLIELPAYIVCYFVLDSWGRKKTLSSSLILSGIFYIANIFIDDISSELLLTLFLFGKFSVTISYNVIYIYTTELFPTSARHSLFAICSMVGRIGGMAAPQIPILAHISPTLPMITFGVLGVSSGVLSLVLPETLNTQMPDTFEEAMMLNKRFSKGQEARTFKTKRMQVVAINEEKPVEKQKYLRKLS